MAKNKPCSVIQCGEEIKSYQLMCDGCWKKVPLMIKFQVKTCNKRGHLMWERARKRAIQAVNKKETNSDIHITEF